MLNVFTRFYKIEKKTTTWNHAEYIQSNLKDRYWNMGIGPRKWTGSRERTGGPESWTVSPPWKLYFNPCKCHLVACFLCGLASLHCNACVVMLSSLLNLSPSLLMVLLCLAVSACIGCISVTLSQPFCPAIVRFINCFGHNWPAVD